MSLPRSRSHNGPTNPRNKPQLKPTRKRNSRSKGLRLSAQPGADHPRGGDALSAGARRTIRKHKADRLKMPPKRPILHLEKLTVRPLPADHPRRADCLSSHRGLSAKPCATEHTTNRSKERQTITHGELDEQLAKSLLADRPQGMRGPSAWCADNSLSPTS
jgi:hypothetical protein